MNGTIVNQCRIIEQSMALLMRELGVDRAGAYRYAYTRVGTRVQARGQARTQARARVLNSNSNLSTNRVCVESEGAVQKSTHTHMLDLDVVLDAARKEMPSIPIEYVEWWYKTQAASDWVTTNGKPITPYTWRANLSSWWRNSSEKERGRIENEMKAERIAAAETKRVLSAADFAACAAAHCLYYNDERQICSACKVPCENVRACPGFRAV